MWLELDTATTPRRLYTVGPSQAAPLPRPKRNRCGSRDGIFLDPGRFDSSRTRIRFLIRPGGPHACRFAPRAQAGSILSTRLRWAEAGWWAARRTHARHTAHKHAAAATGECRGAVRRAAPAAAAGVTPLKAHGISGLRRVRSGLAAVASRVLSPHHHHRLVVAACKRLQAQAESPCQRQRQGQPSRASIPGPATAAALFGDGAATVPCLPHSDGRGCRPGRGAMRIASICLQDPQGGGGPEGARCQLAIVASALVGCTW